MKLKELDSATNIQTIKVRIPIEFMPKTIGTGLTSREVYIFSQWFSGIWVKTDLSSQRMYPLQINPSEVLEWEIV